jgi:hypothetical protein
MHKNFGEWYRLVSIEPHGETLTKRWAGVEAWVSTLQRDDTAILETVRIFQGLPSKVSREPFVAAFRSVDPAFPQRNELELRVLAGASLVRCVQSDEEGRGVRAAIIAGAAVVASALYTPAPPLNEIIGEVVARLQEIARSQRWRGDFDTDAIREATDAATQAVTALAHAGNWGILRDQIVPVFHSLLKAVRHSESALTTAAHSLRCADEEADILWWLEGGSSRDLDKPWSAVPKDAVPLIASSELADMTDVALGPQDAAAILDRVVTKAGCGETSIQAYVNAVPVEWLKAREPQMMDEALDLAPLSLALFQRGRSNSSGWQEFFEGTSGLKLATVLPPARVAHQAYIEAVFLRTLADAED